MIFTLALTDMLPGIVQAGLMSRTAAFALVAEIVVPMSKVDLVGADDENVRNLTLPAGSCLIDGYEAQKRALYPKWEDTSMREQMRRALHGDWSE